MKFSVLLPTRNGGKYLQACIESVLNQQYQDMELIVFDNANTDNTAEIVKSFISDNRLKYYKTDEVVGVTENWSNALRVSSGEYVLMIGDDDYLLPGYFNHINSIIEKYNNPDAVTYRGFLFIFPYAFENKSVSYYAPHFKYESKLDGEKYIVGDQLKSIVYDMFRFRPRVPLNTIAHIWSRKLIERVEVEGDLFRPPYPDHFALNSLLLKADNWVFSKENTYIAGVTPESCGPKVLGFSEGQQREKEDYIGIPPPAEFPNQLPGASNINNMHTWLQLLKENYPSYLQDIRISRTNYVRHQVYNWISRYRHGSIDFAGLRELFKLLSLKDKIGLISVLWDGRSLKRVYSALRKWKATRIDVFFHNAKPLIGISTPEELYHSVIKK